MKITFLGGAGEYGRSCFLLEFSNTKLLIDCGVMKSGKSVEEQYPRLTKDLAKEIDAVFLTHAHEDHTGALPYLAHLGFQGDVFATKETIKQTNYYLKNWRETQLQTMGQFPYSLEDEAALSFKTIEQWEKANIPGLEIDFGKSGHLPGSVWYVFQFQGKSVFFSGDFSMESLLLHYDYPSPSTPVTYAVVDGAYGVEQRKQQEYCEAIVDLVEQAVDNHTSVVVIAPPYGRAQDLLFLLKDVVKYSDTTILIDEQTRSATEEYVLAKEWIKPEVYEDYCTSMKRLEKTQNNQLHTPFIAFYSERALLANPGLLHAEGMVDFMFTGPENQQVVEMIRKRPQGTFSIVNTRYKVHPALYETEKLLRLIQPEQTLLTHSSKEVCDPLAQRLQELTGLDILTAAPK